MTQIYRKRSSSAPPGRCKNVALETNISQKNDQCACVKEIHELKNQVSVLNELLFPDIQWSLSKIRWTLKEMQSKSDAKFFILSTKIATLGENYENFQNAQKAIYDENISQIKSSLIRMETIGQKLANQSQNALNAMRNEFRQNYNSRPHFEPKFNPNYYRSRSRSKENSRGQSFCRNRHWRASYD